MRHPSKTGSSERSRNQGNAYVWRLAWERGLFTIFREYKEGFAILRGLRKQLTQGHYMRYDCIGSICEDPVEQQFTKSIENGYFRDDVSGKVLDPNLVRQARADERTGVFKHKLFDKVPIQECYDQTGAPPVSTKWVDTNKSDTDDPDYRSRWVGREF